MFVQQTVCRLLSKLCYPSTYQIDSLNIAHTKIVQCYDTEFFVIVTAAPVGGDTYLHSPTSETGCSTQGSRIEISQ